MELYLYLSVTALAIYLLFWYRYNYWKRRKVPFCKPRFIVGNFGDVLTLRTSISTVCKNLYRNFTECRYVGFFNMWTPAILIRDPEIIKDVLVKDFESYRNWFEVEESVDPVVSLNPFVLYGSKWKEVRNVLTPQFTALKMKSMMFNIQAVNENMITYIKRKCKTAKCVEITKLTKRFTGDSVMLNAFGLDGRSFRDDCPDTFKIAAQICSKSRLVQLKQTVSLLLPKLRKLFKVTFIGDRVPQLFKNIITDCINYRNDNNVIRKDYLGYLNEAKEKSLSYYSSTTNLIAHAFTFFLDGFETSALTFSYALFELSQNVRVQVKAKEEINTALRNHNNVLSYEALQDMKYVECIVLETLRKYPIIKILGRVCVEDVLLPSPYYQDETQKLVIKKGTEVFISCEGIHNDSEYYPNPNVFDPDRFTEEKKTLRPKYSFLGFGDGPRICLGRNFALTQIKLGLIAILSEFKLEMNNKTDLPLKQENGQLFMSPKSEIWLNFTPVTYKTTNY